MKKYLISFVTILMVMGFKVSFAESDTGKIVEVYSHPGGQMALLLDNGLPVSNAINNCGHTGGALTQWAGVSSSVDPSIKSAILAAKATNSQVVLVTLGNCVGTWIQIEAMHVK